MSSLEIAPDTCSHFSNDLIGVLKSADTYGSALLLGIMTQRSPGTINSIVASRCTQCFRKGPICVYVYRVGVILIHSITCTLYKGNDQLLFCTTTTSSKHLLASTYDTKRFPLPYYEIHARFQRTCLTELRFFFLRLNRLGCSAAALLSKWSPDKREAEISLSISLLANSEHNESWHYPRAPVKYVGGQLQW